MGCISSTSRNMYSRVLGHGCDRVSIPSGALLSVIKKNSQQYMFSVDTKIHIGPAEAIPDLRHYPRVQTPLPDLQSPLDCRSAPPFRWPRMCTPLLQSSHCTELPIHVVTHLSSLLCVTKPCPGEFPLSTDPGFPRGSEFERTMPL